MKKSPLKAADATLVQGAYNAAAAGIPRGGQDGMSQGMDKLMEISADAVKTISENRAAKQKEGDDLAQKILDTGGAMDTSWLDLAQSEVEGMHGDYKKAAAWGKKNKTAKGMQDLNTFSSEIATIKDTREAVAKAQEDKDWSNAATEKELGVFNAFMSKDSKKRISKDDDGNRTFEVYVGDETMGNKGWMSTADISRMADDHKKDYTTMVDIRKQAIDVVDQAKADAKKNKEEGYTGSGYDITKATAKMDNTLRNANLKSLMHDDVLENGTPWVKAVRDNPEIMGMTYESLGINPKMNSQQGSYRGVSGPSSTIDLDGDGKISKEEMTLLSPQDRELITDALTNPDNDLYEEERTRGLMASYFTSFVNKQYKDEYTASGGNDGTNANYNSLDQASKDELHKEYL